MKGPKGPHKATPWVLAVASATRRVSPCSLGAFFPSTHGGTLPGGHPYSCCARRNGRAFSSLTARGGFLPLRVMGGPESVLGRPAKLDRLLPPTTPVRRPDTP